MKNILNKIPNRIQGIIFIIMAGFFFSLMTFFVRLSGDVPTMQKAFFRNAVAVLVSVVLLSRSEEKFKIKKGSWPSILLRCVFGTSGLICNFYAIDKLGLADANMLNKLSPFFAIVMSIFVLKERVNKVEWFSVFVAFLGALFIIKPSFNMTSFYGLVGLYGGFGAGVAYTFVRKLGKMGERSAIIVLCFSSFSTIVTLPYLIFAYSPMKIWQWISLIAAGIAATGGQLCITTAYTKAPAREISVFDYSQILFAAILGFVFFGEMPDIFSYIGYVLIIGIAVFKWRYALKKEA